MMGRVIRRVMMRVMGQMREGSTVGATANVDGGISWSKRVSSSSLRNGCCGLHMITALLTPCEPSDECCSHSSPVCNCSVDSRVRSSAVVALLDERAGGSGGSEVVVERGGLAQAQSASPIPF